MIVLLCSSSSSASSSRSIAQGESSLGGAVGDSLTRLVDLRDRLTIYEFPLDSFLSNLLENTKRKRKRRKSFLVPMQVDDNRSRSPRRDTPSKRVYVGNLAYEVRWQDLKDFMRQCTLL
jgi:RNA recognition motif-containing protein